MHEIRCKNFMTPQGHVLLFAPVEANATKKTPIEFLEENVCILPDTLTLVDAVHILECNDDFFQCFITSLSASSMLAARIDKTDIWIAISENEAFINPYFSNIDRLQFDQIQNGFIHLATGRNTTGSVVPTHRFSKD